MATSGRYPSCLPCSLNLVSACLPCSLNLVMQCPFKEIKTSRRERRQSFRGLLGGRICTLAKQAECASEPCEPISTGQPEHRLQLGASPEAQTADNAGDTKAWRVGPWVLEPRGLAACGNVVEAPDQQLLDKLQEDRANAEPKPESYVECLSACSYANKPVGAEEVAQFLKLSHSGEEAWGLVADDGATQVHRYHDHSICSGLMVRLRAHLPCVSNLSHVAGCYLDFKDRATWDKQLTDFRVLHNRSGSDILHSVLHIPAFSDRDFVMIHAICRHADGQGLLIYMRAADSSIVPKTKAVRSVMYVTAVEITMHPAGGVNISVLSALDPQIAFVPKWIMNSLVPSEWRKSVRNLLQHCNRLKKEEATLQCAELFKPLSASIPRDIHMVLEQDSEPIVVDIPQRAQGSHAEQKSQQAEAQRKRIHPRVAIVVEVEALEQMCCYDPLHNFSVEEVEGVSPTPSKGSLLFLSDLLNACRISA